MKRILVLGGTSDATLLAHVLKATGQDAIFSYAGRTMAPTPQPLPTRTGGFGGVAGLENYLRAENITHLIDATHPFAAQMSRNAIEAARLAGVNLMALERAPWQAQAGDCWHKVADIDAALAQLPDIPSRIFLAIGRQNISAFAAKPAHFYLLRFIDAPGHIPLPRYEALAMRGPFTESLDRALLENYGITHIVAKNAGGEATRSKIDAARTLKLPVIMIERPVIPARPCCESTEEIIAWLAHDTDLGV